MGSKRYDTNEPSGQESGASWSLNAGAALLAAVALGLTTARGVHADTVTVCTAGCDFTTIQAAVDDPGVTAGDVILVDDPVHTEAGIVVGKDVAIRGRGAESTIVQAHAVAGEASDRVFLIPAGATVTIRGMTIRHGNTTSEPLSGGGIRNEGTLTLEDCVVGNNSGSAGGAILNDGTLTLVNSAVRDNRARGGAAQYVECSTGGGIKVMVGTATLINSTVSGNDAKGKGGGVHVACQGTLVLFNSTVSGNVTSRDGGGVYLNGIGEFTNSTISRNSAANGGGVYVSGTLERGVTRGLLNYTSTIIAGNTARRGGGYAIADCVLGDHATIGANTSNLVGDGSCSPEFSGDALLEALRDNGGATQTHALLPDSPAVDAVAAEMCATTTDQRGQPRPAAVTSSAARCDIGAFELQGEGAAPASGEGVGEAPVDALQGPEGGGRSFPIQLLAGLLILASVVGALAVARHRRRVRESRPT